MILALAAPLNNAYHGGGIFYYELGGILSEYYLAWN